MQAEFHSHPMAIGLIGVHIFHRVRDAAELCSEDGSCEWIALDPLFYFVRIQY